MGKSNDRAAQERVYQVFRWLIEGHRVQSCEIMEEFDVSLRTAQIDLEVLAKHGLALHLENEPGRYRTYVLGDHVFRLGYQFDSDTSVLGTRDRLVIIIRWLLSGQEVSTGRLVDELGIELRVAQMDIKFLVEKNFIKCVRHDNRVPIYRLR